MCVSSQMPFPNHFSGQHLWKKAPGTWAAQPGVSSGRVQFQGVGAAVPVGAPVGAYVSVVGAYDGASVMRVGA